MGIIKRTDLPDRAQQPIVRYADFTLGSGGFMHRTLSLDYGLVFEFNDVKRDLWSVYQENRSFGQPD
jgi:hypothetical protein